MQSTPGVLKIEGLSRGDAYDLLDALPAETAETRAEPLPPGRLGEPATLIVLATLSMTALTALTGWLASRGKDVELTIGLEAPGFRANLGFKARSGDSASDLAARAAEQGIEVPEEKR